MDGARRTFLLRLVAALFAPAAMVRAGIAQVDTRRAIEVRIEGRKVVAPAGAIRVTQGEVVELRWRCDEVAELHLHGYDIEIRIHPPAPAVTIFEAHASGRFPITSHGWGTGAHRHKTLTYLEVYPR